MWFDFSVVVSGESPSQDSDEIDVIPERKDQIRLVLLGKNWIWEKCHRKHHHRQKPV